MEALEEYMGTITSKGQVTIPVEVRRILGVKPRDTIVFRVKDGRVELQPPTMTLEEAFGAVKPLDRPEDFEKLKEQALDEHVRQVLEEMKS
jgi:antitoxin PrlF